LPIDAPNLSALLGKAVLTEKKAHKILTGKYRRYNIVAHCLMAQGASLGQYINVFSIEITSKKRSAASVCRVLPICQDIAYSFCFTGAETEIHKIKDDSKIIRQTNLDRRGLRPIPIIYHLLDPPSFLLPTTFNASDISLHVSLLCRRGCFLLHSRE
jgi:hypothetical protein